MAVVTSNVDKSYRDFSGSAGAANAVPADVGTQLYDWGQVAVSGTFVGTLLVEGSNDGTTWYTLPTAQLNAAPNAAVVTGITAPGVYGFNTPMERTRIRCSAYTSGTIDVRGGVGTGYKLV